MSNSIGLTVTADAALSQTYAYQLHWYTESFTDCFLTYTFSWAEVK